MRPICMSRNAPAVARIRQELRERLMAERHEGVWETLAVLDRLTEVERELRGEYERWKLRFELLAMGDAAS